MTSPLSTLETLLPVGTQLWVPCPSSVWRSVEVSTDFKIDADKELHVLDNGVKKVFNVTDPKFKYHLRNPEILIGENDLTSLSYLHEPAVLYNLSYRFSNNTIYTYCGIVLVAINPYDELDIYNRETILAYRSVGETGGNVKHLDPHIFAVAEDAYTKMDREGANQSIIVSGESGAGKTVSAKYAMRYFATVGGSNSASEETQVEKKVLASNPLMEAIGNAKTTRNDNSSRFGKYVELNFDSRNVITGASMRTYLLEKSRVVFQSPDERNYHIFYQMCRSRADHAELSGLFLDDPSKFTYTNKEGNSTTATIDDKKTFLETFEALNLLQFGIDDRRMVFKTLAGILQLGNVEFTASHSDEATIPKDSAWLQHFSTLLQVDFDLLRKTLTTREITSGREKIVKKQTINECAHARDALAKLLYSSLFLWIVDNINQTLNINNLQNIKIKQRFIGVLDIYGFETFDTNSFEQFCINYANEKLQQQFNLHVFKLDQETYISEGIEWTMIEFYDNQPCIDLIESKLGILDLLDEECRLGNSGSDASWLLKLHSTCEPKWKHYIKPKLGQNTMFAVQHFADTVTYTAQGFIEKNRDAFNSDISQAILSSKSDFVTNLIKSVSPPQPPAGAPTTTTTRRAAALATTGSQFMTSLSLLMTSLNSTTPHYVRCIKPNDSKLPFVFENVRAVQQLRACGVLETIRISAAGFPSRWTYAQFLDRYRMLLQQPPQKKQQQNLQTLSVTLVQQLIPDDEKYRLGKTRIFFRAGQVARLEKLRLDKLKAAGLRVQKTIHAIAKMKTYKKLKRSAALFQRYGRGYIARKLAQNLRENKAATHIQKNIRCFLQRRRFTNLRKSICNLQRISRGYLARKRAEDLRRNRAATIIQSYARMMIQRKAYREEIRKIILVQSVVRRKLARRRLKGLKLEARSLEHVKQLNKGLENKIIALQQKIEGMTKDANALKSTKAETEKLKLENDNWRKQDRENKQIRAELTKLKKHRDDELLCRQKLEEEHVDVVAKKVAVEEELRAVRTTVEEMKLKLEEVERENERLRAAVRSDREHIDKVFKLEEELERERERRQDEINKRIIADSTLGGSSGRVTGKGSNSSAVGGTAAAEVANLNAKVEELDSDNKRLQKQLLLLSQVDGDNNEPDKNLKKVLEVQNKEITSLERQVRDLTQTNSHLRDQLSAAAVLQQQQSNDSFSMSNTSFQQQDQVFPVPAVRRQSAAAAAGRKHIGMLEYRVEDLTKILRAIIFDLPPSVAVKERPSGLPAYIVFMMIRYTDYQNDDQLVRDLLAGAISFVKRVIRKKIDNLDMIVLWLTNVLRLLHTLKQYSGDSSFQADNTPQQNEHALKNFDLSEYRQVLSDHAVWIYMLLIKKLEDGIQSLIVPAVLENAGIDVTGGSMSSGTATSVGAKPMENLTTHLDTFFGVLSSYELDFEVIQQVFKQMYYYICAAALNNLLLRKELCNWQKAIEIRYNVSTLEEWCRRKKLDAGVAETLAPVVQASQLLQARKNEKDVQGLCDICDKLSVQQVVKLLNLYTSKDGYENERVSRSLINSVQKRLTEMRDNNRGDAATATTSSLLMDTKYSFSVKFPFNPSAVALETLLVPESFAINNLVKRL